MLLSGSDIVRGVEDDDAPALVAPLDGDDPGLLQPHQLRQRLRLRRGEIRPNISIPVARIHYFRLGRTKKGGQGLWGIIVLWKV